MRQVQLRLLDAAEGIVERIATPVIPTPPPAVMRRTLANTLGLWKFCANSRCKRSECCRGEPLHCLHIAMPLLTAESIAAILPKPGRPNHSRHRAQPVALPVATRV